jgi:quercetin dioxygenase-like cupin family protein
MSLEWYRLASDGTRTEMASFGGSMRCLDAQGDAGGRMSVVEHRMEARGGPPMHTHFDMDELIVVLEGGPLTVQVDDRRMELSAGESVFVPRGTPHTIANLSDRPLRGLGVYTPGGMERELHAQAEYLASLQPGQPPDPARIAAIWKDNGAVVGPPIR